MGVYVNHTCKVCSIKRPAYYMKQVDIEEVSGSSGWSLSLSPFAGKRGIAKSVRVHSGRKYKRRRKIWVCLDDVAHHKPDYYTELEKAIAKEKAYQEYKSFLLVTIPSFIKEEKLMDNTSAQYLDTSKSDKNKFTDVQKELKDIFMKYKSDGKDYPITTIDFSDFIKYFSKSNVIDCNSMTVKERENFWNDSCVKFPPYAKELASSSFSKSMVCFVGAFLAYLFINSPELNHVKAPALVITFLLIIIYFVRDAFKFNDVREPYKKAREKLTTILSNIKNYWGKHLKKAAFSYLRKYTPEEENIKHRTRFIKEQFGIDEIPKSSSTQKPASSDNKKKKTSKKKKATKWKKSDYLSLYNHDDFDDLATTILSNFVADADGKVDDAEMKSWKSLPGFKSLARIYESLPTGNVSIKTICQLLKKKYSEEELIHIVNNLYFIAEADGNISPKEINLIEKYASYMKIPKEKINLIRENKLEEHKKGTGNLTVVDDLILDDEFTDIDFE